jgi:histidine ammonia-lyase
MTDRILLDGHSLTPATVERIARTDVAVELSSLAGIEVKKGREVVETYLREGIPAYGLNTGLGLRVTERLPPEKLDDFSYRMVRARAQGLGEPLPQEVVRAIIVVRLNTMLSGSAGQSAWIAPYLAEILNRKLVPIMPRLSSVGAADLVGMAGLAHALMGEGEMIFQNHRMGSGEALKRAGLEPLKLGPKDGQTLSNNTAFTTGQAALVAVDAHRAVKSHLAAAALALEGFRGNLSPIAEETAALRPLPGQVRAAADLRGLLHGSLLFTPGAARRLQDPLSFRCIAQVFGAAYWAHSSLEETISVELNSSSDNPVVLPSKGRIVTTGNFHQLQLALAADQMARALGWCTTDSISRVARLMNPVFSGLPPLLSSEAAERAGFGPLMKPAEALRAEIVHLATPVPIMPSYNADGQEDSLSHAPLAVHKLADLLVRYELIVSFELLAAAQAVELAKPEKLAPRLAEVHRLVREISPFIDEDRPLARDIEAISDKLVRSGRLAQL